MNREAVTAAVSGALAALLRTAGVTEADGPDAATEKVARALAAAGCHGPAHDPLDCPVATWVRRRTGFRVALGHTRAVATVGEGVGKVRHVVALPAAVAEAMRAIDGRRFPWLTGTARAA